MYKGKLRIKFCFPLHESKINKGRDLKLFGLKTEKKIRKRQSGKKRQSAWQEKERCRMKDLERRNGIER